MSENYGLGGIIGIRGLGGERLAAASYALRQNFQKVLFCANGEESRVFVVCFLHTSGHICLYIYISYIYDSSLGCSPAGVELRPAASPTRARAPSGARP